MRPVYRRLVAWLKSPAFDAVKIPARASFPTDSELERRIVAARSALPPNNVKRLIESQPDSFVAPMPFDDSRYV
jgi:hypothetical protein